MSIDNRHWYAVQTQHRYELICGKQLEGKGYTSFVPTYCAVRKWSDRVKKVQEPLFPGYLFCRLNPLQRLPVLTTPRVLKIVGAAGHPIPIPDAEVEAIQAVCSSGLTAQPWPFLTVGEAIVIEDGPLRGLAGILLEFKAESKLVVSVQLLNRSLAVNVDRLWIRPALAGRPAAAPLRHSPAA